MFVQATQLLGQRLVALESQQLIGKIERLVLNPASGQLSALAIRPKGWFSPKKLLAASDILGIEPGFILTRQLDDLVSPKELLRLEKIMKEKIPILGQSALTESGQKLGQVHDVLLETDSWLIAKYYVRQLLSERIYVSEDVQSITKKGVIFFDRVSGPVAAQAEPAASVS